MTGDARREEATGYEAQKAGVVRLQPRPGKSAKLEFFQLVGQFQIHHFRTCSLRQQWCSSSD
jgi:hypothetical protein